MLVQRRWSQSVISQARLIYCENRLSSHAEMFMCSIMPTVRTKSIIHVRVHNSVLE